MAERNSRRLSRANLRSTTTVTGYRDKARRDPFQLLYGSPVHTENWNRLFYRAVRANHVTLCVDDWHFEISACGGPVAD